jgi:hypothetical protein
MQDNDTNEPGSGSMWSAPQLIQLGQAGESRAGDLYNAIEVVVSAFSYGPSGTLG